MNEHSPSTVVESSSTTAESTHPASVAAAPETTELTAPLADNSATASYVKENESAWSVFGRSVAARLRMLYGRATQRITQRTLRIGISARIFHPEPDGKGLRGKTLQYLEESIAHWVMSRDVLVFMIPTVGHQRHVASQ